MPRGAVPKSSFRPGSRPPRHGPFFGLRGRSIAAALAAYVLVGAFIGLAGWKLTETAVETMQSSEVAAVMAQPEVAAVAAPPPAPRGPHLDVALLNLLERQAPANGFVGLYVRNLTTGAEASINPNRVFPAASLYKVPIMVEAIRQIRLGRISADQTFVVQKAHWVGGSGVLQSRVGDAIEVRELLRLLIAESDNIAAMMLIDITGLNNVNQTMRGLGLNATSLADFRAQNANNGLGPYVSSPQDMAMLLDTIATGRLVDQQTSDEALKLLSLKQASDLLGEALPWDVKVAHKWGEIPGARHEAGIILTPKYKYVIVVMTESVDPRGSPSYIRDLSKSVYDFFEQQTMATAAAPAPASGETTAGQ
ncbi:MAG: serine hydrolase [Chloroflexi bacterium]|nr:serine hydrolase [Chloroflexota bacterium]